jgi:hypothetical protein
MAYLWFGQKHKMGVYYDGDKPIKDGEKLPTEKIESDSRLDRWVEAGIVVDEGKAKQELAELKAKEKAEKEKIDAEFQKQATQENPRRMGSFAKGRQSLQRRQHLDGRMPQRARS